MGIHVSVGAGVTTFWTSVDSTAWPPQWSVRFRFLMTRLIIGSFALQCKRLFWILLKIFFPILARFLSRVLH